MIEITITHASPLGENQKSAYRVDFRLLDTEDVSHEETKSITLLRRFCTRIPAVGERITCEAYEEYLLSAEVTRAAVKAVDILAYGDNTAKQLSDKLKRKGFSTEAVERAVAYAVEKGYIKEEDQLRRLVQTLCSSKYYGRRRITEEIYQKGFDRTVVKAVLDELLEELDFEAAIDARICKLPERTFSDPAAMRRAFASLMRYGFSPDEIKKGFKRAAISTEEPMVE